MSVSGATIYASIDVDIQDSGVGFKKAGAIAVATATSVTVSGENVRIRY